MVRSSLLLAVIAVIAGCSSNLAAGGESCASDGDCADGAACLRGECTTGATDDVRTCSSDPDCNVNDGEVCSGGICVARVEVEAQKCDLTSDCPIDQMCDGTAFVCIALPAGWCRDADRCDDTKPLCTASSPSAPGRCVECMSRDDCGGAECLSAGVCASSGVDGEDRPVDETPIENPCGANATETAPGVCVCDSGFMSDGAGHCVPQVFEPDPGTGGGGGGGTTEPICPPNAHEVSAGQCVCDDGYALSSDFTSCVATGGGGGGGGGTTDPGVPAAWTCFPSYYGDGGCDCGCGALDEDCASLVDVCDYDNCDTGAADPTNNAVCVDDTGGGGGGGGGTTPTVPASWTCAASWYSDAYCDCGCGALDPTCGTLVGDEGCDFDGCGTGTSPDPANNAVCVSDTGGGGGGGGTTPPPVPASWTCTASYYSDALCDCGCGVLDPACETAVGDAQCDFDGCATGTEPNPADNTQCTAQSGGGGGGTTPTVPAGWTCNAAWYDDGSCDCGCGAADSDCSTTVGKEVCDFEECPTGFLTNPANNGTCVSETASASWTCNAGWWNDGECDCGCGVVDADCMNPSATECAWDFCPTGQAPAASDNGTCQ